MRDRRLVLCVFLCAVLAVAVRLPHLMAAACINSDGAVVVLMARHFARGELTPFFWGQRYMGVLEPLLVTPLAWIGHATPQGATEVAILLSIGQLALCCILARRLRGLPWITGLLMAVPAAATLHHHTALYGARLAATSLMLWATVLAVKEGALQRRWLLCGALAGVAYYGDHLMLIWALPIAYLAQRERGGLRLLLLGAGPFVLFSGICAALSSGGMPAPSLPWTWHRNALVLLRSQVPLLLGLDWAARDWGIPATPARLAAAVLAIPGFVVLMVGACSVRRSAPVTCLLFVVVLAAALFVVGQVDPSSERYMVPAWPALCVLAGIAAASSPARLRWAVMLVTLPAAMSIYHDGAMGRSFGQRCQDDADALGAALRREGVTAAWADYWDSYRFDLLLDERFLFVPYRGTERRPQWTQAAERARPVGYLLRRDDEAAAGAILAVPQARRVSTVPGWIAPGAPPAWWPSPGRADPLSLIVLPASVPGWRLPD